MENDCSFYIDLPPELITYCFQFIRLQERFKYRLVSKDWYKLVTSSIEAYKLSIVNFVNQDNFHNGVKSLYNLKRITVDRNHLLNDNSLEFILKNTSVNELVIKHCNGLVSPKIKSDHLEKITFLNLNMISCEIDCPRLEKLCLGEKLFLPCKSLANLVIHESVYLHTLEICQSLVTDSQLEKILNSCKYIKNLFIAGCSKIESPKIMSNYLEILDLSHTLIDDKALTSILDGCHRNLKELRLIRCTELISPTLKGYFNLETIQLRRCPNLRSPSIELFSLKHLHLDLNDLLSRPYISAKSLETLDVSRNSLLTANYLQEMIHNCPKLVSVNVKECYKVDSLNIKHDHLLSLNLTWCTNINEIWIESRNLRELICTGISHVGERANVRSIIQEKCPSLMRFIF